jgi:hypothetical protein
MKRISNNELIEALETRVEKHIKQAVSVFQNLNEEVLLRPSASGGWSIAQCLWHLNSYGHYYLPALKKGLSAAENCATEQHFESGWLGNYFTQLMEPKAGMKKMGAFKNQHSEVAEFIRQQETLLQLLRTARHKNLNHVRIPVSIMPWVKLKAGDVLQFLIAHNERHLQQAMRNV